MAETTTQSLVIEELTGPDAISAVLSGGAMARQGAEFGSETKGGKHLPIGARTAILAATGASYDDTEMQLSLAVPFLSPGNVQAVNFDLTVTPEGVLELLLAIRQRARLCNVQIASFKRVGILRKVTPKPGRGYSVDPATGQATSPGVNLEVTLRWEWSGEGTGTPSNTVTSTSELAGKLSKSSSGLASAIANGDPFTPSFFEALSDKIGNARAAVGKLRTTLQKVGNLAQAPARLAQEAANAARSCGNVLSDLDNLIADTADEYVAAGNSLTNLMKGRRSLGEAKDAMNDGADVVAAVLAALERRARKLVGVRPGMDLTVVAAAELGDPNRWTEIAEANDLPGQIVPAGTFAVEIPPR